MQPKNLPPVSGLIRIRSNNACGDKTFLCRSASVAVTTPSKSAFFFLRDDDDEEGRHVGFGQSWHGCPTGYQ
jgi:hypothetical protein